MYQGSLPEVQSKFGHQHPPKARAPPWSNRPVWPPSAAGRDVALQLNPSKLKLMDAFGNIFHLHSQDGATLSCQNWASPPAVTVLFLACSQVHCISANTALSLPGSSPFVLLLETIHCSIHRICLQSIVKSRVYNNRLGRVFHHIQHSILL